MKKTNDIIKSKNIFSKRAPLLIAVLLVCQLAVLICFGAQKKGMHFDEFFSYFNTNNSVGRQVYDREWISAEDIKKDFYVLPGERFNYSYVITLQGYDVHPPLFYILLHTLCSFMPYIYSVWQGLALNILYALITTVFFFMIAKELLGSDRLVFALSFIMIINPGIITDVMFIRMYCLMTMWITIGVWLHIRMDKEIAALSTAADDSPDSNGRSVKRLFGMIPLKYVFLNAVLAYLGFLTHYFYLVFLFFIEAVFVVSIFVRTLNHSGTEKNAVKALVTYCFMLLIAGVSGVLSFPQSLGHVNSGYRGKEVKSYLFDLSDMKARLDFFGGLVNKYVFGGLAAFFILLAIISVLTVNLNLKTKNTGKDNDNAVSFKYRSALFVKYVFIPMLGYYIVSVKASLMGDEAMLRYQLPVYPLIILSALIPVFGAAGYFSDANIKKGAPGEAANAKREMAADIILLAFICFTVILNTGRLLERKVYYLYPEQEYMKAEAAKHSKDACIYIYNNEDNKYFLWNDAEQLWQYDGVYFAYSGNTEPIEDERINTADKLIVYVSAMGENAGFDIYKELICGSNKNVTHYKKLYDATYATVYEFE